MNLDAPDGQRAVVAAEQLLGGGKQTGATVTVPVGANVEALWLFGEGVIDPLPTIVGATSGYEYPVFWAPWQAQNEPAWFSIVALVTSEVDQSVVITFPSPPATGWYVVADQGGRFVLDVDLAQTIQTPGVSAPTAVVVVGGSDGTAARTLKTDSTGALVTAGSAFPPVYAAPGAAAPADALQVGGTDGTDLRALLTDATGRLEVVEAKLELAIAALGAALPADAVLAGGSDGTDLRALLTDTTGKLLTVDQKLEAAIATPGSANPADAVQIAGTDLTDLRVLQTDAVGVLQVADNILNGARAAPGGLKPSFAIQVGGNDGTDLRVILTNKQGAPYAIPSAPGEASGDRPPNELLWANNGITAGTITIIPAPGAGKRLRLFYFSPFGSTSTATYFVTAIDPTGTNQFFVVQESQPGVTLPACVLPLTGFICNTNTGVTFTVLAGTASVTIGYTVETV